MNKNTFYIFLALFAVCGGASAANIVRGPYIENVTLNSAVIRWRTDSPAVAWIEYGVVPDCARYMTFSEAVEEHAEAIYGLEPGTTQCYRIFLPSEEQDSAFSAASGEFRTLRPSEQTNLEFLAFGDSGSGSEEQSALAGEIAKFSPDFVLHMGDVVESGLDEDADIQYFAPYRGLAANAPVFIALGNHDYGKYADIHKDQKKSRQFISKNYYPYHQMPDGPGSPHYYYFDSGNARFVALDTNRIEGIAGAPDILPGSQQLRWLEYALAAKQPEWKFVFLHLPVYSSGYHGSTKGLADLLAPIFEKYGVDMVFQGHDHDYERTLPIAAGAPVETGGVIYVTLGGGGSPLFIKREENNWSAKFLAIYHFAYLKINGKSLEMKVYNTDGDVVDELALEKQ